MLVFQAMEQVSILAIDSLGFVACQTNQSINVD